MKLLAIIPQSQELVALFDLANIPIDARINLVEYMLIKAEDLYFLAEDATVGTMEEMITLSDLPQHLLSDINFLEQLKIIYYRTLFYLAEQLNIIDLPRGIKYVHSMDDYKIVIEITDNSLKDL